MYIFIFTGCYPWGGKQHYECPVTTVKICVTEDIRAEALNQYNETVCSIFLMRKYFINVWNIH